MQSMTITIIAEKNNHQKRVDIKLNGNIIAKKTKKAADITSKRFREFKQAPEIATCMTLALRTFIVATL